MKYKFFRAIVSGASVPLDGDEIEKVAHAVLEQQRGILILKAGLIDLRSPVSIAPDDAREKRYWDAHLDDREDIKTLPDQFAELRQKLAEKMSLSNGTKRLGN